MKNIITNLLGLIFWILSVYEYFTDRSIMIIFSFIAIGVVLFRYKWSETKKFFDKVINNKIDKVVNTVDPDREYPDGRG